MKTVPKMIIATEGEKGGESWPYGRYKAVKIDSPPIDTYGCGDSFAGGLLGYMAINGTDNPLLAVQYGTAVASYTVSGFGLEKLSKINLNDLHEKIKNIEYDKINF